VLAGSRAPVMAVGSVEKIPSCERNLFVIFAADHASYSMLKAAKPSVNVSKVGGLVCALSGGLPS
jgi:hypothetical protein